MDDVVGNCRIPHLYGFHAKPDAQQFTNRLFCSRIECKTGATFVCRYDIRFLFA